MPAPFPPLPPAPHCTNPAKSYPIPTRLGSPGRPIAAPLDQCAELLGVDLATVRELAAGIEPYVRAEGATIFVRVRVEQPTPPLPLSARRR